MFNIPIAYTPVFINMNYDLNGMRLEDLIVNNSWNIEAINCLFGNNWNSPILSHGKICFEEASHWIWLPASSSTNLSSKIYSFLNSSHLNWTDWNGWSNIWKLNVTPKVKMFIWLLIHGKIKTFEFLYRMNLGPPNSCIFCGLVLESTEHLFSKCHITARIWKRVECLANIKINLVDIFNNGQWLDFYIHSNSKFLASIIAATCWQIWKCRCNCIFKQDNLDINKATNLAFMHVKEFSFSPANHRMQIYVMQNRPSPGSLGIFLAAAWNVVTGKGGLGFFLIDSNANVFYAGYGPSRFDGALELESRALHLALSHSINALVRCSDIYISSAGLWRNIHNVAEHISWLQQDFIMDVKLLLQQLGHPHIDLIPYQWNCIATGLAGHGLQLMQLSLFHRGTEKPNWLMKSFSRAAFSF